MPAFIYKITNSINNKIYIGKTVRCPYTRFIEHLRSKCRSMAISRAIVKYGKDAFALEIIEECSISDVDQREIYYIDYYKREGYTLYNITSGGGGTSGRFKIPEKEHPDIIDLYESGLSLREIAIEYKVDKATIKQVLVFNNIDIHKRCYKYSTKDIQNILKDVPVLSRKEIQKKYRISKAYLSQLINGKRRI